MKITIEQLKFKLLLFCTIILFFATLINLTKQFLSPLDIELFKIKLRVHLSILNIYFVTTELKVLTVKNCLIEHLMDFILQFNTKCYVNLFLGIFSKKKFDLINLICNMCK